ncbi:hypothetical protein VFPBJ_01454 [Purpureocillium lilacinum]|uniref:Uncharacterized protein n=1 Tax=Purpureocillium lilacinum TaxID=33203 RepID=A0A179HBD3_PURLI|nr:hypothetical protein VFPBJ_01454 [Purpureocillium lilacinum]
MLSWLGRGSLIERYCQTPEFYALNHGGNSTKRVVRRLGRAISYKGIAIQSNCQTTAVECLSCRRDSRNVQRSSKGPPSPAPNCLLIDNLTRSLGGICQLGPVTIDERYTRCSPENSR